MEDFNQYLNDDSAPEEREAARNIKEGLAELRLQEKVKAVAAERASLKRNRNWIIAISVLALMAGAAWWYRNTSSQNTLHSNPDTTPTEKLQQPDGSQQQSPDQPPAKQDTPKYRGPVAQVQPDERIPNPRYPAPEGMTRGGNTTSKIDQALLNQLWYTDYPLNGLAAGGAFEATDQLLKKRDFTAAYIKLQRLGRQLPVNDTLRYLQAYCLLEMGQGEEAQPLLKSLQGHVTAWDAQLEWYQGLSLLQSGEKESALNIFSKIAGDSKHPYRAYGKKAVGVLK